MRTFSIAERRARLAVRHRLAPAARATSPVDVAAALVGVHSSDPVSVFLEFRARLRSMTVADLEQALYKDRSLVRLLGMRRTLFVVPSGFAPVVQSAVTYALAGAQRRRLVSLLGGAGIGGSDPAAWLRRVEADTLAAIERHGEASAADLSGELPELRMRIPLGEGRRWQGEMGVSTRVLWLLAMDGRIVRTRPRGSWVSSQYRWASPERWLGSSLGPAAVPPAREARTDLVRAWLRAYGPATLEDLTWWSGLGARDGRMALHDAGAVEVDLDGSPGLALSDDLEPTDPPGAWVALLPGLDATVMGWKLREWYVGGHHGHLFDRNGNAGPTVWVDGRVVGAWAQRADGEIAVRLLEDVGHEARDAIAAEGDALGRWLGRVRVSPRFVPALARQLAAGEQVEDADGEWWLP